MKRICLTLIFALLLLCLLSSCSSCKKDDGGLDKFEQLIVSTDSPENEGEAFADAAYVVVSHSAGFELVSRAVALADALTAKTGIATFLKYDSEPTVSGTFEILLGYTTRLVAKENLTGLRDGDYICRYDRGYIVLGGRTESATLAALDKFEAEILPGASYAAIMSKDAHFEVMGEYPIDELTINGYPIHEYTIVYDDAAVEIADAMARYVKVNSGFTLSCVQLKNYDEKDGKSIRLVIDDKNSETVMTVADDGSVTISAPDCFGLSFAATSLAEELFANVSGKVSNAIFDSREVFDCGAHELDIAFGFADNTGNLNINLLLNLSEAIRLTDSELICFYPTKSSIAKDIVLNCPSTRTALKVDVGNGKTLPILYTTDRFSSVTTEQRDGTVWIKAASKDGKEWCVRIDDCSDDPIKYHSDEILLLSGTRLGDGKIDLLAMATYGTSGQKIENRIYSESAACTKSATVAELSKQNSYFGIFSMHLIEKYHESFIALKDTFD
jgi:hypothetical protein